LTLAGAEFVCGMFPACPFPLFLAIFRVRLGKMEKSGSIKSTIWGRENFKNPNFLRNWDKKF
jgi:hypothetical protein